MNEAFAQFEKWKEAKTVLKLAVYEREAQHHFMGSIDYVDRDEQVVGFVEDAIRMFVPPIDLRGAHFVVESCRVEASDPKIGKVIFEEVRVI